MSNWGVQRRTKDSGDVEHLLAGHRETEFHMITEATHAAVNARLNQTNGYGCAAGPRGSARMLPKVASSRRIPILPSIASWRQPTVARTMGIDSLTCLQGPAKHVK